MKPQPLFDLYCNGDIVIRQRPMSFIKAFENKCKGLLMYKGCTFTIKYNSTNGR